MKPEVSLGVALAVGTAVLAIHTVATPTMADTRTLDAGNKDVANAERTATWMSAGLVSVVSLLARDPMIFIVGGAMTVGVAWWSRHSNTVNPITQALPHLGGAGASANSAPADMGDQLPSYTMFADNPFAR
jgi:hypothetical protein